MSKANYRIGRQYLITTERGIPRKRTFLGTTKTGLQQWGADSAGFRFVIKMTSNNRFVKRIEPVLS